MTMRAIIPALPVVLPSISGLTTREQERLLALARRHFREARRHAVLSDYYLGLKVDAIAHRHGISARMVSRIAADHGTHHPRRPHGRPRLNKTFKSPTSPPASGIANEPFGSAGGGDQQEQAA